MPKTVRVVFHQRLHHHWRSGFTGSHLSYTNHPKHQCQAIVKVPGSFRPAARNEHLYSYCNFTGPMVETVGKSLRHSCRSELTRQGISLPYDGYSYHRRSLALALPASPTKAC